MKKYPIQYGDNTEYIPYEMILEHESQCKYNHCQDVFTLAKRHGTTYIETLFILKDRIYDMSLEEKYGDMKDVEKKARTIVLSMSYQWLMNHNQLN